MPGGISIFKKRKFINNKRKRNISVFLSPILLIPSFLVLLSSALIFSIQRQSVYNDSLKHLITGLIGYLIAVSISNIPLEKLKKGIIPFYILSLICLILIYSFGISIYGAQRWLNLGFIPF